VTSREAEEVVLVDPLDIELQIAEGITDEPDIESRTRDAGSFAAGDGSGAGLRRTLWVAGIFHIKR